MKYKTLKIIKTGVKGEAEMFVQQRLNWVGMKTP